MSLFDKLKGLLGHKPQDAVEEAVRSSDEIEVPATRAYIRAVRNYQKKRGAGWTRAYRKGRTQR